MYNRRLFDITLAVSIGSLIDVAQEECSELACALSKLKRAISGSTTAGYDNPTNISPADAFGAVREEYTDLMLAIDALTLKCNVVYDKVPDLKFGIYSNLGLQQDKTRRWYDRLCKSGCIQEDGEGMNIGSDYQGGESQSDEVQAPSEQGD